MKCNSCGTDLKKSGILYETSILSHWNEESKSFVLNLNDLTTKDFEVKCPECYSLGIDTTVEKE